MFTTAAVRVEGIFSAFLESPGSFFSIGLHPALLSDSSGGCRTWLTPCSQIEKGCKVRKGKKNDARSQGRVTLKALAEYVGLSTGTISIVLNDTPRATVIPQRTKDRILEAARVLNYRSNPFARALRANWGVTASAGVEDAGGRSGTLMFVGPEHWRRAIQAISQRGPARPGRCFNRGCRRLSGGFLSFPLGTLSPPAPYQAAGKRMWMSAPEAVDWAGPWHR